LSYLNHGVPIPNNGGIIPTSGGRHRSVGRIMK
jgi:hypothetical protein